MAVTTLARRTLLVSGALVMVCSGVSAKESAKESAKGSAKKVADEPRFAPALYQGMEWRNIGPFRGGRSNASAGVPTRPGTFYFGGVGSGMWKTEDRGETWANVSDATFGTSSVGAIAVAPSDPNVVYVGMGEHAVRGVMTSHGDGVYRSTDAGKTWSRLGLERTRQIAAVVVHPQDPDLVYVAAQGAPYGPTEERGIYRSRDGGTSWEKVLYVGPTAGSSGLSMDPTNPRILYAAFWDHLRLPWEVRSGGPGSGLWKSTDAGSTWQQLGETVEGGLPKRKGKLSVAVSADPERVYALVEADPGGGLYRSDDAGKTWKLQNEDWGTRARAWYYIKVYADPQNPDVVWITNAELYKSIDGGKSFAAVAVPHGDNHHLWIHPHDSDILINSNDGGANVSYNGGKTWSTQQNQPTGQFYRVITDNQYPYHVYGGQQDNSAIGIKSQAAGGIGWEDFYSIAGCESAWAAFHPDDPELVYGGCYMGIIAEWQRSTATTRDAMAYPMMPAALASRDMRYRFNWSAPIVASPHDPTVLYHAGNVVLRTADRGRSWREISPDLTRDDDEKQGPGGGPITNEGAGGEIYGTIYTLAASPLARGTLWTGSDDGRVHVTRDEGATWSDVTPPAFREVSGEVSGEFMVNAIEASPHDPARAYVALTRYKWNDFTPLAFKTADGGQSWTRITNGIEAEDWVRVVREDPVRPGLLYLGTETGVYVSFDDGERFQSLQLNLPVTPVTDLTIQRRSNDLVASTAGRGFWILDDLSPLQQLTPEVASAGLHLFAPEPAIRPAAGRFELPRQRLGKNPPGAAILDFFIAELPATGEIAIEIRDGAGRLVLRFVGEEKKTGKERPVAEDGKPPEDDKKEDDKKEKTPFEQAEEAQITKFELKAGMNRVAWDGRHRQVRPVPGLYVFGSLEGRRAIPGSYEVRLTVREETRAQPLEVRADPREPAALSDYQEQDALLVLVERQLEGIHDSVLRLRSAREQIKGYLGRGVESPEAESLAKAGQALVDQLDAMEDRLIQKRTVDGQTVINFPTRLNQHFIYLYGALGSSEGIINQGARERLADLSAEWSRQRAEVERLLLEEVEAFNQLVRERQIPAIQVKAAPYLVVLGIAQDGGVPQAGTKDEAAWRDATRRRRVVSLGLVDPRRTRRWLFEATPDLPEQLAELDRLAPDPERPGLDGIFLTHAHMGHYTGLMYLGFEALGAAGVPVYAMPRLGEYLKTNGPWDQLVRYRNVELRSLADGEPVDLGSGLRVAPFLVPHRQEYSEVVGFRIEGPRRAVLFLPDIDGWEEWEAAGVRVEERLAAVDVAYLDGCFFDQGEIPGRDMSGFPHPLIAESLERFAALPAAERGKIRFLHLNHTNPALDALSAARRRIVAAGMAVAEEGERLEL